jgi:uracil-DNA glycosylase
METTTSLISNHVVLPPLAEVQYDIVPKLLPQDTRFSSGYISNSLPQFQPFNPQFLGPSRQMEQSAFIAPTIFQPVGDMPTGLIGPSSKSRLQHSGAGQCSVDSSDCSTIIQGSGNITFEIVDDEPARPQPDQSWSVLQAARDCTPRTWEDVFKDADMEIATASQIVDRERRAGAIICPLVADTYRAFHSTPLDRVKVVIIGQDPYHQMLSNGLPRAKGMSFSIDAKDGIPSSLQNIYKELGDTVQGFYRPNHGDLTEWAVQGVLMLNMCLTVRANQANSHGEIWMGFISKVLRTITDRRARTIFLLWGKEAQKVTKLLGDKAIVLTAAHPSGFSARRGFFGCNHFNETNQRLAEMNEKPINWQISSIF